jgi:hypothetical protein
MARASRHLEVLLYESAADRVARAARHALLTCALAFGQRGGGEQEVLFAVARSYTAAARARDRDARLASDIVQVDDGQIVRRLLGRAEGALCAAAKALPHFNRHTVRRLVRAARAYTDAWELDRAWALRLTHSCATSSYACTAGAQPPLKSTREPVVTPLRKEPPCHR